MKREKQKQKAYIPLYKIAEFWRKGHTCEGDKGGSFNIELYLNYCKKRELSEIKN